MNRSTKTFIEQNVQLIDKEDYSELFRAAHMQPFPVFFEVDDVLKELGVDTNKYKLEAMFTFISEMCNMYLQHPELGDASNSWSRLRYQLDNVGYMGMDSDVIVEYYKQNHDKFGLKFKPLDIEYSWDGDTEYDLGWFIPSKFEP